MGQIEQKAKVRESRSRAWRLLAAFATAAAFEKPVITAVSPAFSASYRAFVEPYGSILRPDEESLYVWGCRRQA